MQLSVTRQTYNGHDAAELAYSRRPQILRYIKEQLRVKRVNEAAVREDLEDIMHDGLALLLVSQFDCANADEAISEAMSKAVQERIREVLTTRTVSENVTVSDSKDVDREVSRFDKYASTESAEEALLSKEEMCSLREAIEKAEAVRYSYGVDILLALLLRIGTEKQLWSETAANGLLLAFESAMPSRRYIGDSNVACVIQAAVNSEPGEIIQAMYENLSRCDTILSALGYNECA